MTATPTLLPNKIMILGGGGREHAIGWKLKQQHPEVTLWFTPGNAGTATLGENLTIGWGDVDALVAEVTRLGVGLVVVGPEAPLTLGVVDALAMAGVPAFGPSKAAATLEASKQFAKAVMADAQVPTARYVEVTQADQVATSLDQFQPPYVIKEDGLAAGKGVTVTEDRAEAEAALRRGLAKHAGAKVLIEEFLVGEELSVLAVCDGETAVPLVSAQDFKRAYDGNEGPNTGGMGAYAPVPFATEALYAKVQSRVLAPMLDAMRRRGTPFKGILYAGLMIHPDGDPYVVEFNVRFGDPETQAVLPVLEADLLGLMMASIDGTLHQVQVPPARQSAVSVVVATGNYPESSETGLPVTLPDDVPPHTVVFHAGTRVGANGQVETAGGRVFNVTALAPTIAQARERAYQVVPQIRFERARHRRDIGLVASEIQQVEV
jgi:phosphoribosylamine---glycine ligase